MLHGAEVGGFSFVLTVWWGKVAPPKVESDGVDKRRGEKKRKKKKGSHSSFMSGWIWNRDRQRILIIEL